MVVRQLSLFQKEPAKKQSIYYVDLNINQRINLRANSCGFSRIYYHYPHQKKYQKLNFRYDIFNSLSTRYVEHYKLNY
jgi:hypothetical protein